MYSPTQAYQPGSGLDSTTALLIGMKEKGTLQSYVAAHKGKPEYPQLLALATSINNISSAEQAARYQPPAQTVADQRLAALAPQQPQGMPQGAGAPLPEEQGIGQLPARNLQKMADGGIAGYASGGPSPDAQLAYNNEPVLRMAGGGMVAFGDGGSVAPEYTFDPYTGEMVEYTPDTEGFFSRVGTSLGNAARAVGEKVPGYGQGLAIDPLKNRPDTKAALQAAIDKRAGVQPAPSVATTAAPTVTSTAGAGRGSYAGYSPIEAAAATGGRKPPLPDIPDNTKMPGANMGLAGLAGGKSTLFQKEEMPDKATYAKEYDALYKALDEKNAKYLENQKAKLKTDREEALYMSMIKGGLAAAAGTSQYGLTNLAKGFGEGAEDFNSSLKEFRKAAQETAKMEMDMERAQADRKAGRLDKYDARMESVKNRQLEADKAILSANTTLQHANITAGATIKAAQLPPKEAQMAAMLGTGNTFEERFQSGLPKLTAIQAGKFDPRKAYTEYLVAAQKSGTGDILSFPEFAMQFAPRVPDSAAGQKLKRKD